MLHPIYKDKAITLHTTNDVTIKDLEKMADNLIDFLQYHAKKNSWKGEIVLCGSEQSSHLCIPLTLKTGGRPKKYFFQPKYFKTNKFPHIHMMLLNASPNTTITSKINEYWIKRNGKTTQNGHKTTYYKKVYAEAGFRRYMKTQSTFWREAKLG